MIYSNPVTETKGFDDVKKAEPHPKPKAHGGHPKNEGHRQPKAY